MLPSVGALISFGLAAFLSVGVLGLILEGMLIKTGKKPITTYVRNAVLVWPGRTLTVIAIFVFSVGALFGHMVWDAGCG